MYAYIARRGLLFIPTILLATILVFGLFWIVPGDAAMMILTGEEGDGGKVTEEDIKRVQRELGLDRPVYIQYGDWLWKILQGDFGDSVWYGTPVLDDLKDRFFITLELAVLAIVLAFIAAVPLGVYCPQSSRIRSWTTSAGFWLWSASLCPPSGWGFW